MGQRLSPRVRFLGALLLVGLALIGLDRLLYSRLLFALPNYSGWDSFRWYNFEYNFRRLEREAAAAGPNVPARPRVLIVGSSIAKYSVQTDLLEAELERRGAAADVRMAVHAAMMPTDLYYYRDRLKAAGADLVVYLTNPADLDLERYLPPFEAGGGYSDASMENYLAIRHPMLIYYPGAFALEHRSFLDKSRMARLALREWFHVLRYKDEWRPIWRFFNQVRGRPVRSYLNYQGAPVPEGIWRDGWTGACFTLRTEWLDEQGRLFTQVLPELQGLEDFRLEFFAGRAPGAGKNDRARDCSAAGPAYASIQFRKADWQYIAPPLPPGNPERIFVRLSHVWDGEAALPVKGDSPVWLGRGLRLPGYLGRDEPLADTYYKRYPSLEDARLKSLSDEEYSRDFIARVHPFEWREERFRALGQFNKLRLSKYYTNWYDWSEIYQAREIRRFTADMRASGVRVLLINNPENPLTRAAYEDNEWYRGYLGYFTAMAAADSGVFFADLRARGPMQEFVDAHHLTFNGVERMAPEYAALIARALMERAP